MSHDCKAWPGTCGCTVAGPYPGCTCGTLPGTCPVHSVRVADPACTCGPSASILPPPPCPVHSAPEAPEWVPLTWNFPAPRSAWECPRCQKVNAPHVDQCPCVARAWTFTTTIVDLAPPAQEVLKARCKACGTVTEEPKIGHVCPALFKVECSGCGGGPFEGCSACQRRKLAAASEVDAHGGSDF